MRRCGWCAHRVVPSLLLNPTTGFLEIHAWHGLPHHAAELKLRVGEGLTGWVARTGKAARVGEVANDPRYIRLRPEVRSETGRTSWKSAGRCAGC